MTAPENTQGERKNPYDMKLDECRDELARNRRWCLNRTLGNPCGWLAPNCWVRDDPGNGGDATPCQSHPIPATLDEAAELPEGWRVTVFQRENGSWAANAQWPGKNFCTTQAVETDTELLARFRLRVAVERATRADAAEEREK